MCLFSLTVKRTLSSPKFVYKALFPKDKIKVCKVKGLLSS